MCIRFIFVVQGSVILTNASSASHKLMVRVSDIYFH